MNEIEFDANKNYFYLYEQAVEENKKLRERINYPKIELDEFMQPFQQKEIMLRFLLGDGFTFFHVIECYDAFIDLKDNSYKETIINHLLQVLGYRYMKRAYDYWQKKGCKDE